MDYKELTSKYGNKFKNVKDTSQIDLYNKKYLLLTPDNYDTFFNIKTESDLLKYNNNLYTEPINTGEYIIDLKTYIVTKTIKIEFIEFYNTWPQLHNYNSSDTTNPTPVPNVIYDEHYEPIYFTIAISTTSDTTGYTAYALRIGPNSFTAQEFVDYVNLNFIARGITMSIDAPTNSILITTTTPGLRFCVFPMDINFTLTPGAFSTVGWFDPLTNALLATQPQILSFDNTIRYNMGWTETPIPTFGYTTSDPFSTYNNPYSIANGNLPAISLNAFVFDMEEFIFLRIEPFNSTLQIANSAQFHNFVIPNSGGRGELNQFNANTNCDYNIFFENKIVLNKLSIKWSFYSGQTCHFSGIAPIILISYVPYATTDSRVPFNQE